MANNYQNRIDNFNSADVRSRRNVAVPKQSVQQSQDAKQNGSQKSKGKNIFGIPVSTRLNAMDSTLLESEAYQDIEDDNFKREYKINQLEQKLNTLENDIENAKSINDMQKVDILTMRKHSVQKELRVLKEDYGNYDITTKLSGDITNILNTKPIVISNVITKISDFVSTKLLSKISKSFHSNQDVKTALAKLTTLNKNVDELINMQTPYGEADEWYDKLSDYLNTANVIHFQISKTVGTPTFFDTISSIDKDKIGKKPRNNSNFNNMAK